MAEFKLSCKVTVGAYTLVEAESYKEAITKALARSVAFEESGVDASDTWIVPEPDGSPFDIYLDE
jgi:hypothetical protein